MIPLAVYTESENESHSCPLRVIAISQRLADTMAWPTRWLGQHDVSGNDRRRLNIFSARS